MAETKNCPYCGEEILATAKKCKHCKEWLEINIAMSAQEITKQTKNPNSKRNFRFCVIAALAIVAIVIIAFLTYSSDKPQITDEIDDKNLMEVPADIVTAESEIEDKEVEDVRRLLANSIYTNYHNARFAFSFNYPDCFIMGKESENGDGCAFSMKYGIIFSVWGSYNISDFYGEDIKEFYKNDEDRAKSTYHVQKDNWFVMSGNFDDEMIFYKKVVLMNDCTDRGSYVTLYLLFPKKFDKVLADFISYEAKNFNPVYEGTYTQKTQDENLIDPLENLQIEAHSLPKREEVQSGNTRDQQIALLLMMLAAAANSESGTRESQETEYPCRTCGLTFSSGGELRYHELYVHAY